MTKEGEPLIVSYVCGHYALLRDEQTPKGRTYRCERRISKEEAVALVLAGAQCYDPSSVTSHHRIYCDRCYGRRKGKPNSKLVILAGRK